MLFNIDKFWKERDSNPRSIETDVPDQYLKPLSHLSKILIYIIHNYKTRMKGLEPLMMESKSTALPLGYIPMKLLIYLNIAGGIKKILI